ncbi:MAG: hypothetical protein IJA12_01630 [Oscillospiraceae bacterium]|nr:hypothetical protein [Oscillospiraceae bacterium]
MENLQNCIEKLLDSKPVYDEPVPQIEEGGKRRKNKKLLAEEEMLKKKAVSDFGYNQNAMNIDLIKTLIELQRYCKKLENTIEESTMDYQKLSSGINVLKKELDTLRLRSTLNSNQIEKMDAGLYKYTEKLDSYMLSISPGIRNTDCPKGCIETDISDTIGYFDKIEAAKQSADMTELEKFCHTAMNKSLAAASAFDEIVIDFYGSDRYAAWLYGNLSKNSIYKIKLLKEGDIPSGHFSIICTETAFVPRKLMLKSAIVLITGEKPFEDINADELQNLKFLNDCGLHTYITLTDTTQKEFVAKGFRCVKNVAPEKLLTGEIIYTVEKAMDNAVPSGAVSYNMLKDSLENPETFYLTDADDIADYHKNRCEVYPYNALAAMESAITASVKNNFYPTGIVNACRISTAIDGTFNFIDGMNYVNHLNYENRKRIYARVKSMLEPDGIFIMNAYDSIIGVKIRSIRGWNYYPSYEALWTREQLINELEDNRFKIKFLIPTGAGLFDNLPAKYKKTPTEWIIGVTK